MKLLSIDTSTEACSAALLLNDNVTEKYEIAPRRHAELILPMVDSLLADAQLRLDELDGLAFGRGPGAFTGVRIATGVAQGLAYGADIPVIPVSTLAAMALDVAQQEHLVFTAIDARMEEVYWGLFETTHDKLVNAVTDEAVSKPEQIQVQLDKPCIGVGTGWLTYTDQLSGLIGQQLVSVTGEHYPRAKNIAILAKDYYNKGKAVPAKDALPVYLRNKVTF